MTGTRTTEPRAATPPQEDGDAVMWCHNCMTFQRRAAMPLRVMPWWPKGGAVRSCVVCPDEPEGLGVWDMTAQPDPDPCWAKHADAQDDLYPGECACGDRLF